MTSPKGPLPGSTPPDSDELGGNPSPWHTGEKLGNVTDVNTSQYPILPATAGASQTPSVAGYFFNPQADPYNPYHDGSGSYSELERGMMGQLKSMPDDVYARNLGSGVSTDAPNPNSADSYQERIRVDTGQDDMFVPLDERR